MTGTAEMWTVIASGGRWTMDELREALPALGFGRVRAELWRMARIGSVTRYEDGRYGITPDCVIPAGMTMREVLAAAGVAA